MKLPSIKNINVKGKRVLLRVDFNVPVQGGKVVDDFRIKRTLPTIKFLKKKGAKIILISHLTEGRAMTLRPMAKYLNKYFKTDFCSEIFDGKTAAKISKMKNGGVLMLENIRLDKREEENSAELAKHLAGMGDLYVNDAFSVSHRAHASLSTITRFLPSYAGLLFEEEVKNLHQAFSPKHPFLLILGGIKFGTKLGVLDKFLGIADKIFVGGALANNFFKAEGKDVGKSIIDDSVDVCKYLNNSKIILPIDFRIHSEMIWDCGEKTIEMLEKEIKRAKFILWNGPLGNIEAEGFEKGTIAIAKAIVQSRAKSILGGGDTIAAIHKVGLNKFSFVSTAGGAMLEFLATGTLPGIEALKK